MIMPFVNWGWNRWSKKPNVDTSMRFDLVDRMNEFTNLQREYDSRLSHFESKLDSNQYQEYIELRQCAQKLLFAKERMDYASEFLSKIN